MNNPISHAAALLGKRGGTIGGRKRSAAKAQAARRNGALGGRPPLDLTKLTPIENHLTKPQPVTR